MKKVILFDLYDTVLKDVSFSVQQCFQWLYETYFKEICTFEVFEVYREIFSPMYAKRAVHFVQIHLFSPLF